MFFTSDFIIIFVSSLVAWFLMLNTKPIIQDVKIKFVKTEENHTTETVKE